MSERLWLDDFHAVRRDLTGISRQLASLGHAMRRLGMESAASELLDASDDLARNADALDRAVEAKVQADFEASQQATTNTIQTALAAVAITPNPESMHGACDGFGGSDYDGGAS